MDKNFKARRYKAKILSDFIDYELNWTIEEKDKLELIKFWNEISYDKIERIKIFSNSFLAGVAVELGKDKSLNVFNEFIVMRNKNILEIRNDKERKIGRKILKKLPKNIIPDFISLTGFHDSKKTKKQSRVLLKSINI
jgi:hypothetical protein